VLEEERSFRVLCGRSRGIEYRKLLHRIDGVFF
jgi:hypothetical protein